MNVISEDIFKLYNQLEGDECQPIDSGVVDDAVSIINNSNVEDSKVLFLLLSAINLLNAAIKTEKHKSQLFYGFIKTKVSKIADTIILSPSLYNDTSLFYDSAQKCIYFEVFGVIFSFHQIIETKLIKNVAAKNTPIQWTGVRLQRIAQNLFLYAKGLCPEITDNSKNTNSSHLALSAGNTQSPSEKLVPCHDCGNVISSSARFCPYCGSDLNITNELFDGIKEGYSITITYNGNSNSGVLKTRNQHFVTLALVDEKWLKVRTAAIDSIELIDTNEFSTELFAQQAEAFFFHIFELSNIDKETLISTNSTITQVDKLGLTIIKDSGEIATCVKPGIVGYKKKECTIGKRVYCGNIGANGRCYNSIVEMSYGGLIGFFRKAVSHSQNITQARKAQIMSILTYLMKEMTTNPEVYLEIKKFKKKVKEFLGQLDIECDNFSEQEESNETINELQNMDLVSVDSQETDIYKTETEKLLEGDGLPKLKVLGKIDLDMLPGKKKNTSILSASNSVSVTELSKPTILSSDEVSEFINKKLINLSEAKCKQLEKELDTLIRNGEKEECLRRSYQIINTSRPTPKYLRSYLDRIVNTEIALDHTKEALQSLSFLIVLTEQQEDASANSLGHLYITMARLYLKEQNKEEAQKAILYAESLKPNNNAISKLKDSIFQIGKNATESKGDTPNIQTNSTSNYTDDNSISRMLLEDVRQEAKRQELLPANEITPAEQLFGKAQNNRNNSTESFEEKAQLFLEAAGAYYNSKQTSTIMYQISVANYARLKGHSMYARFANLTRNTTGELYELQACRDSACSYYVEALGIFNALGEKEYLRELLLKYLQLTFVTSQIEGSKTPDPDWDKWTLEKLQHVCLDDDSVENIKTLLSAYIIVGASAEKAWDTLVGYADATSVFTRKCKRMDFRRKAFGLFNDIEQSSIENNSSISFNSFIKQIFSHRQTRIGKLNNCLQECLDWKFDPFNIASYSTMWASTLSLSSIMTPTDINSLKTVNYIIDILRPYANHKPNERYRNLVSSQTAILKSRDSIVSTTTYYGRTFFLRLFDKWLAEIGKKIEEQDANALPKLSISPDPCYVKVDDKNDCHIDFVVSNVGESTAQSFIVNININQKQYTINHTSELAAGEYCTESLFTNDIKDLLFFDVHFSIVPKYQNKDLPPMESEATYEVEDDDYIKDENKIPWTISNTPPDSVFKGREKKLDTLVSHYLSKDRSLTYILYGLTRTGKSSMLDYLRDRINGQSLKEDNSVHIMTFKWYLNEFSYIRSTVEDFWTWAIETNIYNVLDKTSPMIADAIDTAFSNSLPEAGKWTQADFSRIVDVLNEHNIVPLITIDEFSYIRNMLKTKLLDATFISTLRNLALTGKACFVYAGTYDIKDLPKEKEYGIVGQMNNTTPMHINEIDDIYANELIDACPQILFDDRVKTYIRTMSGCIPYWIQWICKDCGKYAVAHKKKHLGLRDVSHVVDVLSGSIKPDTLDCWQALDEENFQNNQITPDNVEEQQLITSMAYLLKDSAPMMERGISMDELKQLWEQYSVPSDKILKMAKALTTLEERKVLKSFTDENREVYKFRVELFRCFWYNHHKDINKILTL